MPAQPSTIASARSSRIAASISAEMRRAARRSPGPPAPAPATSEARTRAQRLARPYFIRLCSIAGIERDRVVTTEKLPAIRLAMWNAASPMPTTGARRQRARRVEPRIVEAGDDVAVDALPLALGDLLEQARHANRPRRHSPRSRTGPVAGLTATISVPAEAAARAAAPILAVIEAVVLGLTTRMRMPVRPGPCRHPSRAAARWRWTSSIRADGDQDHGEGDARRDRAERIDHRRRHRRGQALQAASAACSPTPTAWLERAISSQDSVKPNSATPTRDGAMIGSTT